MSDALAEDMQRARMELAAKDALIDQLYKDLDARTQEARASPGPSGVAAGLEALKARAPRVCEIA